MFESLETLSDVQRALRYIFQWRSWTPELTASTTNPNLGTSGIREGSYTRVGDLILAKARLQFAGSGISNGSGNYLVSLPEPAAAPVVGMIIGGGYLLDVSGARYLLTLERTGSSTAFLIWNNTSSTALVTSSVPVASYAAGDSIRLEMAYPAATPA